MTAVGVAGIGSLAKAANNSGVQAASKARDVLSSMKITRVRFYSASSRTMFNQSAHVCTVETDAGPVLVSKPHVISLVPQEAMSAEPGSGDEDRG